MMKQGYPPVALVEAWIFIETCEQFALKADKDRAHISINQYFGSVESAKNYIKQCRSGAKIVDFTY